MSTLKELKLAAVAAQQDFVDADSVHETEAFNKSVAAEDAYDAAVAAIPERARAALIQLLVAYQGRTKQDGALVAEARAVIEDLSFLIQGDVDPYEAEQADDEADNTRKETKE
jgi:uncharacterized protein YllA (UPF0747 family)